MANSQARLAVAHKSLARVQLAVASYLGIGAQKEEYRLLGLDIAIVDTSDAMLQLKKFLREENLSDEDERVFGGQIEYLEFPIDITFDSGARTWSKSIVLPVADSMALAVSQQLDCKIAMSYWWDAEYPFRIYDQGKVTHDFAAEHLSVLRKGMFGWKPLAADS